MKNEEKQVQALEQAMQTIQMEVENADLQKVDLTPGSPDGFAPRLVTSLVVAYPELKYPVFEFLSGYVWATIHAKQKA